MSKFLRDLPINKKLWFINIVTLALAGVVAAVLQFVLIWDIEFESARANALVQAGIVADNAAPAVQFLDQSNAQEILEGLRRDPQVLGARILLADGSLFAEIGSKGMVEAADDRTRLGSLVVRTPLQDGAQTLGTLELRLETSNVFRRILSYLSAVGAATLAALVLGGLVIYRLQRTITVPLSELTQLMREVSSGGDLSRRSSIAGRDELGELSCSFNRMIEQIEARSLMLSHELSERQRAERQLEHLAHHDPVTGLPNRHFFGKHLSQLRRGRIADDGLMALLFIDLDNFKFINDTFGHDSGDQVLVAVGERISGLLRGNDLVVRFGGDEFVVLLEHVVDEVRALRIASKIQEGVVKPLQVGSQEYRVSCSIGISMYPDHAASFDELLQRADAAMYAAKQSGKNCVELWRPAISESSSTRFLLESDLRQAMSAGQLSLYYQPIIDLSSGRVAGMEALLRWQHPTRGFVAPAEFIPIAEEAGLIIELGEWVMRTAFSQAVIWNRRHGRLFMAVNVSGRQFRDREFADKVESIVRSCGLAPELVELEVTESIVMENTAEAIRLLQDLASRGFSLSMDDFGTGYSSLSYLKRFPLRKLKIDRSFVSDLIINREDMAIVKTIIGLAGMLSMKVVAEGVETPAQARSLRDQGCEYGQGYHFSKPLSVPAVEALLNEEQSTYLPLF